MNRDDLIYNITEKTVELVDLLDQLEEHKIYQHKLKQTGKAFKREVEKYGDDMFKENPDMNKVFETIETLPDRINKLDPSKRLAVAQFITEIENL